MSSNLWIGSPVSGLREITQAARSWDRSADLGVTEFRALDGTVTLSRARFTPRRTKLSWDWLLPEDARHLDQLARRVTSFGSWTKDNLEPGPVALIDPAAANLLGALQAAGRSGPSLSERPWFAAKGAVTFTPFVGNGWIASTKAVDDTIGWQHGTWPGWPVAAGMRVSWQLPNGWNEARCTAQLDWKGPSGDYLSTSKATGRSVTADVPAGACFVTLLGVPGEVTGLLGLDGACLAVDGPAIAGTPGDGCPAMCVTSYTDTPAPRLPHRNISIDLVEVNSAIR
ncbi:hypothetical protein [Streptomyces sp. SPB162]|uniref:hypothetical protein n=1 Tax=Streptomyces sp. SPB162 TaxID=2940560 RepID=UPI002404F4EC|nr:hypothetical protein [Streptomyces sp. SPB162]MDF9814599.1 hypothetical protein [Streptomyces sp. SPB162]